MLTVAYCRVSTEEQAAEGYSIEGQAEKLRDYARLHDLGEVTVVADPGRSGKDMDRPGLQQLLEMVERGHVGTVLVWRLDRLSRNLGDLVLLADTFGQSEVALHSFTEKLDLSSATGRMFYNILGSFAQFYREQLGENVRLGLQQAVKQGKWPNRLKLGYSRLDGRVVPNEDAPVVRRIFKLRAEGRSYRAIEQATGVKYSTVCGILKSRIYLGETLYRGEWFPGEHERIISEEEWQAAHRGHVPGRRRGKQLLSGRVRCGLCERLAAVEYHPKGFGLFRCRHRGQGCSYPRRRASGLEQAAVLGCGWWDEILSCRTRYAGSWTGRPPAAAAAPDGPASASGPRPPSRNSNASGGSCSTSITATGSARSCSPRRSNDWRRSWPCSGQSSRTTIRSTSRRATSPPGSRRS